MRLEILQRYGWSDLEDSTRSLTDQERLYGGGVLGQPTAIAEAGNGDIYILDAAFKKIVVFSAQGDFKSLFIGGAGKGPGEFGLPVNMTWGPEGDLWVLDGHLQRLVRFAPDGGHKATVPLTVFPRLMNLVATRDGLYGARHARDTLRFVVRLNSSGNPVQDLAPPRPQDMEFGGRSLIAAVGRSADGRLLIGFPEVGMWGTLADDGNLLLGGEPIYPGAAPTERTDPEYGITTSQDPAQPVNIGTLKNGRTFLRFLDNTAPGMEGSFRVALFDSAGKLESIVDSVGVGGAFLASTLDDAFFAVENHPYPHVVKLKFLGN